LVLYHGQAQIVITVSVECTFQNCAEVATANEMDVDSTPGNGFNDEDDSDCVSVEVTGPKTCMAPFGPPSIDIGCIDAATPITVCLEDYGIMDPQDYPITIVRTHIQLFNRI